MDIDSLQFAEKKAMNFFYVVQFAYFLTFVSFAMRNITWLRSAALAASTATIYYSLNAGAQPLWLPFLWNLLFILTNGVHLALSRWRSRDVKLDAIEDFLAKTVLMNFPPAEVRSFYNLAAEGELDQGAQLIQSGTKIDKLYCLLKGKVSIVVQGRNVAELGPGRFVGEMSLLTRSKTRADVHVAEKIQALIWTHETIENWVNSDASRLALLQSALGTQIVEELLRQQTEEVA